MPIKLEVSRKAFSPFGGLKVFSQLVSQSRLQHHILDLLPTLSSGRGRSWQKFMQLLYAFIAGADCLDDLDRLALDPAFVAVMQTKVYTAKACGDFLRSFSARQCKQLNQSLAEFAYSLRSQLPSSSKEVITIDIDSTTNRQCGKKMQGLAFNYKGEWGLDTIVAFDELGLPYWCEARPGNTFSSQNAELIIHEIFSRMPQSKDFRKMRRYVRADSAFCHSAFFNACMAKGAGFVITMKANMSKPLIGKVRHWYGNNPKNTKRIVFYDQRECQIGQTLYASDDLHKPLRVVFIRAVKKGREHVALKADDDYDYYSWITNIGEHEMSNEKLISFYRGRGQAENYIKELKYGFDLQHYPCQRLNANKVYGLIACFAYALTRFLAHLEQPKKPQFAKALRFRWIYLPCQVVHHGGQVIFSFMKHHYRKVRRCLEKIHMLEPGMP